jgi:hypothetical protein
MDRFVYNLRDVCDKVTEFRITNYGIRIYGGRGVVYTGFWWENISNAVYSYVPLYKKENSSLLWK